MRAWARARDVAGALVGLCVALPLCAWIAWRVWREDGGPVLFRQSRVGRGGRVFRLVKFRTMSVGAESRGALVTAAGDPRVTPIGVWLRRTKLDELPQLWNVLVGDMTFVGPRPEVATFVARYSVRERAVLALTPGLTDPASLAYIDEEALLARYPDPLEGYLHEVMPEKIRLNLEYAGRATAWRDLGVLAATVRAVASRARREHTSKRPAGATARSSVAAAGRAAALLRHRRVLIVAAYLILLPAGYAVAFLLRYDFRPDAHALRVLRDTIGIVLLVRLLAHWRFGVFSGYWQHFGLYDLRSIVRAATAGSAAFVAALALTPGLPGVAAVPQGVLALDWALGIFLAAGAHAAARLARESPRGRGLAGIGRRALLIGAGEAAERLVRQFRHDQRIGVRVIGLVDDDSAKHGRILHGVPVLGTTDALGELAARHGAELLILAIPSAKPDDHRRLVRACLATGLQLRVTRPLMELVSGADQADPLRTVEVDDLLGRPPVQLDVRDVAGHVAGRVALVTGGAGSIGGEIARQLAALGPSRLVLYDHAESPLYYAQLELVRDYPGVDVVAVTGCVTDERRLRRLFVEHAPDLVFHAAAYKHVPMMEDNVLAAVRTNVFGTLYVARCAARANASTFVLLSTDKAVNPSSVMGATKRVAERVVLEWPELRTATTEFRAVRFGNVLGSDGSVVPLFRQQLLRGGPLTVTHPDVERYFMTVQEAVQLVLQSAALPEAAGRIAMLDMGEPVRVVKLAENLVRLSGREPYRDVPIVFTGLRPGEKLREELGVAYEDGSATTVDKIRVLATVDSAGALTPTALDALASADARGDDARALAVVRQLVPECVGSLRRRSEEREYDGFDAPVPAPVELPRDLTVALPGAASPFSLRRSAELPPN